MKSLKTPPICFVISSPSGAGKTTIVEHLLKKDKNLVKTISHTTRSKRPSEKNGVHYHFVDRKAFEKLDQSGQMMESATVYDEFYGTSKKEIERILDKGKDAVLVIENEGAQAIKRLFPRSVFILILPPSLKELRKRILSRETEDEDIERRLKNATREIRSLTWYDYAVMNEDLEESVELVQNIISAERAKLAPAKDELFKTFLD